MADAERASISPRDAAQDPLPERRTSNWEHWELLALAVLGATFGFLSGIGLFSEIHERSLDTALLVIILALAAYVFIDPIKEWLDSLERQAMRPLKGAEWRHFWQPCRGCWWRLSFIIRSVLLKNPTNWWLMAGC